MIRTAVLAMIMGAATMALAAGDWPVYRHDAQRRGATALKGEITRPAIAWSTYLGAPVVNVARSPEADRAFEYDLDGDGRPEILCSRIARDGRGAPGASA